MVLKATDEQFTINESGELLWQEKVGSPLPGEAVATLARGDSVLTPQLTLVSDAKGLDGADPSEAQSFLETALQKQIAIGLEVLVGLEAAKGVDGTTDAVRAIYDQVYAALGILPREALQSHIEQLDADTRRLVRQAGIKLGPVLVFMPALNKPAAVKMRALLWSLYHEKDLPAITPKDGVVSEVVDQAAVDKTYYQAIGYPIYGTRAVRIDMLDRVISAVYDSADKGKFMAQHQMAEWLGCSIPDLYSVLEAMGHVKVHDPAENVISEVEEKTSDDVETSADGASDKPTEQVKPELATFKLKRGKANQKSVAGGKAKKQKKDRSEKRKQQQNRKDNKRRVMSAGTFQSNPEDSPFAALADLKAQMGEKK